MHTFNTLSPTVSPHKHMSPSPYGREAGRGAGSGRAIPEWSRTHRLDKLAEAYEVIQLLGGKVFTLRLNAGAHARILGSADPGRTLSRRIQREFHRRGVPVPFYAFALEVTPDARNELHLHGAIHLGNVPLKVVKDVLRDAGGRIVGRAGSRQVQIKKFDFDKGGPAGWAFYPGKGASRTLRVIQHHRLTYICSDLRRLCRDRWDGRRRQRAEH